MPINMGPGVSRMALAFPITQLATATWGMANTVSSQGRRWVLIISNEATRIGYFGSIIPDAMIHYISPSQFKALSFPFIFHAAARPNLAEERIRQNLRMHIKFVSTSLVYSTYHNRIQMNASESTLVDYKFMVGDGSIATIQQWQKQK